MMIDNDHGAGMFSQPPTPPSHVRGPQPPPIPRVGNANRVRAAGAGPLAAVNEQRRRLSSAGVPNIPGGDTTAIGETMGGAGSGGGRGGYSGTGGGSIGIGGVGGSAAPASNTGSPAPPGVGPFNFAGDSSAPRSSPSPRAGVYSTAEYGHSDIPHGLPIPMSGGSGGRAETPTVGTGGPTTAV